MNPHESMTLTPELEAQFRAVFEATDANGEPLYSREQLEDFAVEAILDGLQSLPEFELTPQLMMLVERFCERTGLVGLPADDLLPRARDYLKENPPPAGVKAAVAKVARDQSAKGSDPSHQRAALARLGIAVNRITTTATGEGVRATPLARFNLQTKEEEDET